LPPAQPPNHPHPHPTPPHPGVYLLAPMLRTLTKTVSEDSVIAMTAGLLIVHLYLHDYK